MRNSEFGLRNEIGAMPRFVLILLAMIVVGGMAGMSSARAQEFSENEPDTSEPEAETEEVRPTIDLGMFQVKDFRPARNETAKLSFTIHLALQKSVSETTVEQLERWRHRLRNEVIIAIRLTETKEFLEPDLHKFRRRISLRVNRALKAILVSEALLTEFTFTTN